MPRWDIMDSNRGLNFWLGCKQEGCNGDASMTCNVFSQTWISRHEACNEAVFVLRFLGTLSNSMHARIYSFVYSYLSPYLHYGST